MQADWVTWALQFVIMLAVSRVWIALDQNTTAITNLRIDIPTNYATKKEIERHNEIDLQHHRESDQQSGMLHDRIHALDLRVTVLDGKPHQK